MVILNTCRYSGSERGIQFGYCEYANSDRLILCGSGVLRFYSLSTQLFPVTEGYVSPQFFSSFLRVKRKPIQKLKYPFSKIQNTAFTLSGSRPWNKLWHKHPLAFFPFHMSLIAHEIILILGQINETATAFPLFQLKSLLIHKKLNTQRYFPSWYIRRYTHSFVLTFLQVILWNTTQDNVSALMLKRS